MGLACLVGWVTSQRGRGFALGFWVSAIFSPLIGLLVAIALPNLRSQSSTSPAKTGAGDGAVRAWQLIEASLDPGEYVDFITANQGHELAVQAARHKRLLEQWQSLDQRDGQAIERFISAGVFPSLATEVRRVVEENSITSSSVSDYLERIRTTEQAERERQAEQDREAELVRKAQRLKAEEEAKREEEKAKREDANARRLALRALAVLASGAVAVAIVYWFQAFSLQRRIDDKTLACKELKDKSRATADEYTKLAEPLNMSLAQLALEKESLDRKWSERVRAEASALEERAKKSIKTIVRYRYYGLASDLDVTVSNGSPYCLWSERDTEGPAVALYQGATSLGRADPEYSFEVKNAEDRYGFSKGCFIPPGADKSFTVTNKSAASPEDRKRAADEGLRLWNGYYVINRATPENLHFYELSSSTSGSLVSWKVTPVDWRKLAEVGLANEDAARTAELSAQITKLSADIEALPSKAAAEEARRLAVQCQSELTDLVVLAK
jgi:hypothetical protein